MVFCIWFFEAHLYVDVSDYLSRRVKKDFILNNLKYPTKRSSSQLGINVYKIWCFEYFFEFMVPKITIAATELWSLTIQNVYRGQWLSYGTAARWVALFRNDRESIQDRTSRPITGFTQIK